MSSYRSFECKIESHEMEERLAFVDWHERTEEGEDQEQATEEFAVPHYEISSHNEEGEARYIEEEVLH